MKAEKREWRKYYSSTEKLPFNQQRKGWRIG
jgi:hypothetical protein